MSAKFAGVGGGGGGGGGGEQSTLWLAAYMQYTEIIKVVKNENFQSKIFAIFLIFAQNIDCGYTLKPPHHGGSNKYPQSMFWRNNKKNRYTPAYPRFAI